MMHIMILPFRDANIPMWKNPDLILDYASFWSRRDLFHTYTIPALPAESIAKYELGLSSCAKRIEGNRSREAAQRIIQNLQVLLSFIIIVCCTFLSLDTKHTIHTTLYVFKLFFPLSMQNFSV
jgi:hypothetical protein